MPELSLHNIDRISHDVRMQEIGFSHLFDDLVDHICCDVEYHMNKGMDFEEAYKYVRGRIGYRGLKNIQEETLFAVDTKYRNMKKLMKFSGVSGTSLVGFSAVLKILHLPLAGILLSLGAVIISFLFLPSALVVIWKETKSRKSLLLFITAFIAGASFVLGMLFKIQHWPGANILSVSGMATGALFFIPLLLLSYYRDPAKKEKRPIYLLGSTAAIIYTIGFIFRFMSWPFSASLMLIGTVLLFFVVFPWFSIVQWKDDLHINARFIFMVIASLLLIVPGALINLNMQAINNQSSATVETIKSPSSATESSKDTLPVTGVVLNDTIKRIKN